MKSAAPTIRAIPEVAGDSAPGVDLDVDQAERGPDGRAEPLSGQYYWAGGTSSHAISRSLCHFC
jgi:hypothetical protein